MKEINEVKKIFNKLDHLMNRRSYMEVVKMLCENNSKKFTEYYNLIKNTATFIQKNPKVCEGFDEEYCENFIKNAESYQDVYLSIKAKEKSFKNKVVKHDTSLDLDILEGSIDKVIGEFIKLKNRGVKEFKVYYRGYGEVDIDEIGIEINYKNEKYIRFIEKDIKNFINKNIEFINTYADFVKQQAQVQDLQNDPKNDLNNEEKISNLIDNKVVRQNKRDEKELKI